jgi:hypothetical protein
MPQWLRDPVDAVENGLDRALLERSWTSPELFAALF